jgi:hypothetical protein
MSWGTARFPADRIHSARFRRRGLSPVDDGAVSCQEHAEPPDLRGSIGELLVVGHGAYLVVVPLFRLAVGLGARVRHLYRQNYGAGCFMLTTYSARCLR